MAGLDDLLKKTAGAPKADVVDIAAADTPVQKPKGEAPKDLPTGEGQKTFAEVHEGANLGGERLVESAKAIADTAIELAKIGSLSNESMSKLLEMEGDLIVFDDSAPNGGRFEVAVQEWQKKVVDPTFPAGHSKKAEFDAALSAKDHSKLAQLRYERGAEMVRELAKKIQDFIDAENARTKYWLEKGYPKMREVLTVIGAARETSVK